MVLFAGWTAMRKRHLTRTPVGSLLLFVVLALYFAWIAGWSDYVVTYLLPDVPLVVPSIGWLLVLGSGLYFAVHRIENEPIFHSDEYTETKKKYVVAIRILLIASYALLPTITVTTLLINAGNYEGEALGEFSFLFFDSYVEMFWSAYWDFLAASFWPLPIFHFLFSLEVIYAPSVGKKVFIPIAISLCLFFAPYVLMLYVLAFDILEQDYPLIQHVYLYYFLALAPAAGIPLGLASWFGIGWVVQKFRS